jgi:hypothetical protein
MVNNSNTMQYAMRLTQGKEINYKGSSVPTSKLPHFMNLLSMAVGSSGQWKFERRFFVENVGKLEASTLDRTDCLNFFVPKDPNRDISITIMVGHEAGLALIREVEAIDV